MRHAFNTAFAVVMLAMSPTVFAQSGFPEKPVRIIVGFVAGGSGADLMARLVGPKLSEWWRQPVIVDNMPGQVANISKLIDTGLEIVARPPAEFLAQVKAEIVSKGQLIKDSGAKPD